MKNVFFESLYAIILLTACNGGVREKEQGAPSMADAARTPSEMHNAAAPLVFDTVHVKDSLPSEQGSGLAEFERTFVFPTEGDAEQLTWIRQWIALAMSGKNDTLAATPKHTAALFAQAHLAADFHLPKSIGELGKESFFDEYRRGSDEDYSLFYSDISDLQVAWQTPAILSFCHSTYNGRGGAHGITTIHYTCFDLTTNRELLFRDIFLPEKDDEIRQILAEQLCAYFEVSSVNELLDNGLVMRDGVTPTLANFPFPDNTPCLLPKGIKFQYQQYEIGCYAAGMPETVISYAKIWHFITPRVQKLIGEDAMKIK